MLTLRLRFTVFVVSWGMMVGPAPGTGQSVPSAPAAWEFEREDIVQLNGDGAAFLATLPPSKVNFASVRGAALDDGGFVVVNTVGRGFAVFDSLGAIRFRWSAGSGGGILLKSVTHVWPCRGGRFAVASPRRVEVIARDGRSQHAVPLGTGPSSPILWAVGPDCASVVIGEKPSTPEAGAVGRGSVTLARASLDDSLSTPTFLWEHRLPPMRGVAVPGGVVALPLPWTPTQRAAHLTDERLLIGSGESEELQVVSLVGKGERELGWSWSRGAASRPDTSRYGPRRFELVRLYGDDSGHARALPQLDTGATMVPRALPAFDGMLVDPHGRPWLRTFPSRGLGAADYWPPTWRPTRERWFVLLDERPGLRQVVFPPGFLPILVRERDVVGVFEGEAGGLALAMVAIPSPTGR